MEEGGGGISLLTPEKNQKGFEMATASGGARRRKNPEKISGLDVYGVGCWLPTAAGLAVWGSFTVLVLPQKAGGSPSTPDLTPTAPPTPDPQLVSTVGDWTGSLGRAWDWDGWALGPGTVGLLLSKRAERSTEPVAPTHRPAVKHREFWSATNFYQRVTLDPPFSLSPVPHIPRYCSSPRELRRHLEALPFPHRSLMTMDDNSSPGGDMSVSDAGLNSSDLNLGAAFGDLDTPLGYADQACKECRRRKSKCNKAIPTCNLCVKYRRHCLYEKHSRTPLTRKWVFRLPFRTSVGQGPPAPMDTHIRSRSVAPHPGRPPSFPPRSSPFPAACSPFIALKRR